MFGGTMVHQQQCKAGSQYQARLFRPVDERWSGFGVLAKLVAQPGVVKLMSHAASSLMSSKTGNTLIPAAFI